MMKCSALDALLHTSRRAIDAVENNSNNDDNDDADDNATKRTVDLSVADDDVGIVALVAMLAQPLPSALCEALLSVLFIHYFFQTKIVVFQYDVLRDL